MAIANATLAAGNTDILTVPASTKYAILNIIVCNNSGSSQSFDLHFRPDGESVDNENRVANSVTVDAGDTFVWDFSRIIIEETDVVTFNNASTSLSATISYMVA
jgi:hypothetical protein|tara:strand:- start:239 stop:550 length:312 start_codon:yes stop_codon:yes gene_type:complete